MELIRRHFVARRHPGVVLSVAFVVLAVSSCLKAWCSPGNAEASPESPTAKQSRRSSVYERVGPWSLKTLDGKELRFSECKGRVVFLNFWATWCVPCVEEMSSIQRLFDLMKGDNIAFLLVTDEKEKTVKAFLDKHQLTLPIYLRDKKLPKVFRTKRLPVTYILDCQGNIAYRRTGSAEWDDPACQELIRGLMPKKDASP